MKISVACSALALAAGAHAGVIGVSGGQAAMDALVDGMQAIPGQELPEGSLLTDIATDMGTLTFSATHEQLYVGSGWDLWRPGYMDDVYFIEAGATGPVTSQYLMPGGVTAFDFFIQDNDRAAGHRFIITAHTDDGDTFTFKTGVFEADGAKYFGFYATEGDTIDFVEITAANASGGYAIGEWRIVPSPGGAVVLATLSGLLAMPRRRNR